ncbi:MAG TPA: ABC transporter permease [Polyangiaceae bacterium]|nr:ABC transporter permease [Polyangiaceae bacterium]
MSEAPVVSEPRRRVLGALGEAGLETTRTVSSAYGVFVRTLYYLVRGRHEPGAIARQMYEIGNRSLVFVSLVMGFVGVILVYQGGIQTQRVLPDLSQLGATFLELLVRDLAPSLAALMVATRVGAGIAAELGSMAVTEQLDALRLSAADPVDYLVKPRFVASVVMLFVLTIVSGTVAYACGLVGAQVFFELSPRSFVDLSLVDAVDLGSGLAKCLAYGAAIPILSAHAGLTAQGGSNAVGAATTRAVVHSSLAVIALDFAISFGAHALFGDFSR